MVPPVLFKLAMEKDGYIIRICSSQPCHTLRPDNLIRLVEQELGIKDGETFPDSRFILKVVNCIGMCDHPPSMMINEVHYGDLTADKVKKLLAEIKS